MERKLRVGILGATDGRTEIYFSFGKSSMV